MYWFRGILREKIKIMKKVMKTLRIIVLSQKNLIWLEIFWNLVEKISGNGKYNSLDYNKDLFTLQSQFLEYFYVYKINFFTKFKFFDLCSDFFCYLNFLANQENDKASLFLKGYNKII